MIPTAIKQHFDLAAMQTVSAEKQQSPMDAQKRKFSTLPTGRSLATPLDPPHTNNSSRLSHHSSISRGGTGGGNIKAAPGDLASHSTKGGSGVTKGVVGGAVGNKDDVFSGVSHSSSRTATFEWMRATSSISSTESPR